MSELRKIKGGREIRPGVWELRIGIGRRPDGTYGTKSVTVEASTPAKAERARARLVADVDEAAERLGWSRATAYRRIADDTFPVPVIRRGRLTRVPVVPLEQLLAGELAEASGQ